MDKSTHLVGVSTPDAQIDTLTRAQGRSQGQRMRRCERRDAKRLFLTSYAIQGVARTACRVAGISRSIFYTWLKTDARFHEKYNAISAAIYDPRCLSWDQDQKQQFLRTRRQGERLIRYYKAYLRGGGNAN